VLHQVVISLGNTTVELHQMGISLEIIIKGGRDSKKNVDWSDTDTLLPGESIGKAIVLLQIQEVWAMKRYNGFYAKKIESVKRLYRFNYSTTTSGGHLSGCIAVLHHVEII
jgi:hypothetical protein